MSDQNNYTPGLSLQPRPTTWNAAPEPTAPPAPAPPSPPVAPAPAPARSPARQEEEKPATRQKRETTVPLYVRIPERLHRNLKLRACAEDRSISDLVAELLAENLGEWVSPHRRNRSA